MIVILLCFIEAYCSHRGVHWVLQGTEVGLHHANNHLVGAASFPTVTAGSCQIPVPVWSCTSHCVHHPGSYSVRSIDVQLIGLERMALATREQDECLGLSLFHLGTVCQRTVDLRFEECAECAGWRFLSD